MDKLIKKVVQINNSHKKLIKINMDKLFKAAAIQMVSTSSVEENLLTAERQIKAAVEQDAGLVVLPEYFAIMPQNNEQRLQNSETHGEGVVQSFLQEQSKIHNIWLVGGTHPIKSNTPGKPFGRCYLYEGGRSVGYYDKIHLFDVDVNDQHKQYRESDYTTAGDKVATFDSPWGKIGIAVCYDLRFPEMFRKMSEQGVELIVFPAAFTQATGNLHWEVLLKARAIENLSYIVASAQGGTHQNGRETFGHSCIISPWGEVLANKAKGEGMALFAIDLEAQKIIRTKFPVLQHRKL